MIRIGVHGAEFDNPSLDGLILEMREASEGMDLETLVDRVRRVVADYDAGGEGNGSVLTFEGIDSFSWADITHHRRNAPCRKPWVSMSD